MDSIEQVVQRLSEIVSESKERRSRLGYFAALYRQVTVAVQEKIGTGYFDDDARLEQLDVVFASRYLTAYDQHQAGEDPSLCWEYSFRIAEQFWPIVLQHLLLGMNAHINLDLGIATARTAGSPAGLAEIRGDFDRINDLLATLVGKVKDDLAAIWPTLRFFNETLGNVEDVIINFSIGKARDHAWAVAEDLAALDESLWLARIAELDRDVEKLAHVIRYPGFVLSATNKLIRLGERGGVPWIIEQLE